MSKNVAKKPATGAKKTAPAPKSTGKQAAAKKPADKPSASAAAVSEPIVEDAVLPGTTIPLKELQKFVIQDSTGEIAKSGKWPLIVDTEDRASRFIQYQNSNILNPCKPLDMEAEKIRTQVLGAIRYGNILVIDLMGYDDKFELCEQQFEKVQEGLLESIINRSILQDYKFTELCRPTDGDDYKNKWEYRDADFKLMILSTAPAPNPKLLERFYTVRIE